MTRKFFIERTLRQIYGGLPSDDAEITQNLVNIWLSDAIAMAAKANYTDNIKLDGIAYVNGSFYTTFKDISIVNDEFGIWKIELPHLPVGIGDSDGVNTCQIKDTTTNISNPVIWINQSQKSFYQNMRQIPNKVYGYSEGKFIYVVSTILLNQYTASVSMVSGGDSSNLDSELNVPSDYFPIMVTYIQQQLTVQRNMPVDNQNDGLDALKTT
jgi:hypothetical protein